MDNAGSIVLPPVPANGAPTTDANPPAPPADLTIGGGNDSTTARLFQQFGVGGSAAPAAPVAPALFGLPPVALALLAVGAGMILFGVFGRGGSA